MIKYQAVTPAGSYFFNFYSLSLKIFNIEYRFFRRFYIKKKQFSHIV